MFSSHLTCHYFFFFFLSIFYNPSKLWQTRSRFLPMWRWEEIKIQKKSKFHRRQAVIAQSVHSIAQSTVSPAPISPPWLSNVFVLGDVENESLWARRDESNIREWLETKRPAIRQGHFTLVPTSLGTGWKSLRWMANVLHCHKYPTCSPIWLNVGWVIR